MATHSSILPGESHGQRSLMGYSPRGHKESDMTEQLTLSLHFLGSDSDSHLSWPSTPLLGKFSCLPGVVPTPACLRVQPRPTQLPPHREPQPSQTRWIPMSSSSLFATVPHPMQPAHLGRAAPAQAMGVTVFSLLLPPVSCCPGAMPILPLSLSEALMILTYLSCPWRRAGTPLSIPPVLIVFRRGNGWKGL